MYIFRSTITLKNGTVLYAKDYGKRAFKIWVDSKKNNVYNIYFISNIWCTKKHC